MRLPKLHSIPPILVAMLLAPATGCRRETANASAASPSIILVTIDTLRADRLGCYGYVRDTSPHLDALADEAIVFDRCFAPMATTLPSHLSLLTGIYPLEHGITANLKHNGERFVPSANLRSFVQTAREAGYTTAAFVSATPLKRNTGIAAGFDTFNQPKKGSRIAAATNAKALDWLENTKPSAPFLLWVHYFDPHDPYEPPRPYDTMFETDDAIEDYLAKRQFSETAQRPQERDKGHGATVHARRANNLYDGEVRYTDEQVGRLFERLKHIGLWDGAVVIVIGDHGEGLNQHDEPGHGLVWNEQTHIPLIIRVPGQKPRRIPHLMAMVDVLPTLLGFIDIPGEADFLSHTSGKDVLAEEADPSAVFSQISDRQLLYGVPRLFALTDAEWKYVHASNGEHQLYNFHDDPFELRNVIAEYPDVARSMCTELARQVKSQVLRSHYYIPGSAPADKDTLKELGELGYVDDGEFETETMMPTFDCSSSDAAAP